jgi:hypothetical protein
MKLVREQLYERFVEDSDPIHDLDIGQKADAKDLQRIKDIQTKAKGSGYKENELATTMCKLIKDKEKAYRRYLAAKEIGGKKWRVAQIFLERAVELGQDKAIGVKTQDDADEKKRYEEELERKREIVRPFAEKFVKHMKRVFGMDLKISTMSHYPYESNSGLFVSIPYVEGASYSGYSSGGPENVTNYRKSYLGSTMSRIATTARNHNVGLYKYYDRYYVKFPFSQFVNKK